MSSKRITVEWKEAGSMLHEPKYYTAVLEQGEWRIYSRKRSNFGIMKSQHPLN